MYFSLIASVNGSVTAARSHTAFINALEAGAVTLATMPHHYSIIQLQQLCSLNIHRVP